MVRQRLPDWNGKEGIYWYKNVGKAGRPKLAGGKLVLEGEALVGGKSLDASVEGFCVCDWNGDGCPDLIVTRKESMRKDDAGNRADWRRDGLALPARIAAPAGKEMMAAVPDHAFDDLMTRLRAGDDAAAAEVFRRFTHRLIGLARRPARPPDPP